MPTSIPCLYSILRALVLAALLSLGACAQAPTPAPAATGEGASATKGAEGDGKCYQGCITWGQSCNVDPRGVYKCQRRCEKFGEICE